MLIEIRVRDGDKMVAATITQQEYEDSTISLADRLISHCIAMLEAQKEENSGLENCHWGFMRDGKSTYWVTSCGVFRPNMGLPENFGLPEKCRRCGKIVKSLSSKSPKRGVKQLLPNT